MASSFEGKQGEWSMASLYEDRLYDRLFVIEYVRYTVHNIMVMHTMSWGTVYELTQVLFSCLDTRKIHAGIKPSWVRHLLAAGLFACHYLSPEAF